MTQGTDFLSRLMGVEVGSRTTYSDPTYPSDWVDSYISRHSLDPTHLKPLLQATGNILVASCAGSGKTTALSLKVLYDLTKDEPLQSDRVLVATFLRTGSEDLYSRLQEVATDAGIRRQLVDRVKVSTVHAEFYRVVSYLLGYTPEIISDSADQKLLSKVLISHNLSTQLAPELAAYLNRYSNSMGQCPPLSGGYREYQPLVEDILADWKALRNNEGLLSHNDIQDYLIERIKTEPEVVEYLSSQYSRVYLDEYQDVSRAQQFILDAYLQGTPCVAVGDDDQTIYSWRGSDVSIISEEFAKKYNPEVLSLPVNYRCPEGILTPVIPSIEKNSNRLQKSMSAHHKGGLLSVEYGSMQRLLGVLMEGINQDLLNNLSISVLYRTNADGFLPALAVSSLPVRFRSSEGISRSSNLSKAMLGLVDLFSRDPVTGNIQALLNSLYRVPRDQVNAFLRLCSMEGNSFYEQARVTPIEDVKHSAPSLETLFLVIQAYNKPYSIEALMEIGEFLISTSLRNTPSRQQIILGLESLLTYIRQMNYSTPEIACDRIHTLFEVVASSTKIDNPDIVLSTVHDFKGKESDSVYIWNDSEGSFPHIKANSIEEINEERRLHYIAWTRPKKKLTVLSWEGKPSRFLQEVDINNNHSFGGSL